MFKMLGTSFTIKDIDEFTYSVEGNLVSVGKVDLDGDRFLPETDFSLPSDGTKLTDVYYHHGMDETIKKIKLGEGILSRKTNGDIWIEAQLAKRDEYEKQVYQLAKTGKLGWSSGTASHLAEYKYIDGIKTWVKWPLGLDASLTPTPAEYSNNAKIKAQLKSSENETEAKEETDNMSNENLVDKTTFQEFGATVDGKFDSIGQQLKALVDKLDQLPTKSKAGFASETGGKTDKTVKSFGDFLLSVKRRDTERLKTVYGSEYETVKDVTVDTGITGGYAVPREESRTILQAAINASEILPLVTQVPVNTAAGSYPALDQTIATTAGDGDTSMAAGVTAEIRNPGGTFAETDVDFTELLWKVRDVGGYTQVQKEFGQDSPQAIEALLRSLFVIAVSAKNERNVIRGNGVNAPLGVLNAPCAVGVTPANNNVFAWVDALKMASHLKVFNPSAVRWSIHPGMLVDIGQFETTGGGGVLQKDLAAPLGMRILGHQIAKSEHQPQADNSGCVILADWSAYLMFMREDLVIDFSEHVGFLTGMDTWRFYQRNDGRPWLKNKITLADPQGSYYVSPMVYFND